MEGDYERAVELYQSSLELYATAEAHTFLSWAASKKPFPGWSVLPKRAATSRGIFLITIWAARILAGKCTDARCAASRKRCRSSRAIRRRARRWNLCAAWSTEEPAEVKR